MSEAIIRFEHVQKAFGRKVIYKDLSLEVMRGETLVIIGGSGTGKSVMLKLLIGLLHVTKGAIFAFDEPVVDRSEVELLPIRRRISMLFQSGALFDSLSVFENVAYPLRVAQSLGDNALDETQIAERVNERLALVGLPDTAKMMPADLSGGMRKRVSLARAIAANPDVILYDEPTTGLDPQNTRRISELINTMKEKLKVTSMVVTHDIASAFLVADRIAMVHEGSIRAVLTREECMKTKDPVIADFIGAMDARVRESA